MVTRREAAGHCRVGLRTFDQRVAPHVSAHDFRHAALTHMAAVESDLTAIGHGQRKRAR